ncbi:MerR family transcriptional regulator [Shinella sp.]|uniref:MerR family transcriptional regulator n=1 Tax=Shinella sp. TaxID=1870904 RepID=UPI0039E3B797
MRRSGLHLTAAEAARELGVSAKALRLYERNGLLAPLRTAAGWRIYGPSDLTRAREVAALRRLGMGLAQIKGVLSAGSSNLDAALAAHQAGLESQIGRMTETVESVEMARKKVALAVEAAVLLDLPWPWGGERFELPATKPITYITGPLGSGKTRLARAISEALPDTDFIGLERQVDGDAAAQARSGIHLRQLTGHGANLSPALAALLFAVEASKAAVLVIDMVEQGLDQVTQQALRHYLRSQAFGKRPLFLLTRSSSLLDLADMSADETILYCPANHDMPMIVPPRRGARGYEAVATCLATPAVRSRTEGVIAFRPSAV